MNSRNTISGLVLLAITIGGSAMAAPAQDPPPTEAVSYSDLNLKTPAGVARLYRRIQVAADVVCKDPPAARHQHALIQEQKACKARATERAVVQVGIPALNALHLASGGGSPKSVQLATTK